MKFNTSIDKIKWCIKDVDEFKELIEINNVDTELIKRYKLCESISGEKIKNRVENLIVACWSSKDWIKKEITSTIDKNVAKVFETNLFKHDTIHLIQYLADSIKHGGIDSNYLKTNKYKNLVPSLGKTTLTLANNSVPGNLKPTYTSESDDVPTFEISSVIFIENGVEHYNFDSIDLSIIIQDKSGNNMGSAMKLVNDYVEITIKEYNKLMRI